MTNHDKFYLYESNNFTYKALDTFAVVSLHRKSLIFNQSHL